MVARFVAMLNLIVEMYYTTAFADIICSTHHSSTNSRLENE